MKAVESHLEKENPERVDGFKKGAQLYAKKIITNFKDFDFVRNMKLRFSGSAESSI
jgi:hypothetical protein